MFNLPQNVNQLKGSNNGVTEIRYNQYAPSRDVTDNNFSNGAIHIHFEVNGNEWWIPRKSYLKFRIQIRADDGATQLRQDQDVAPNMFLPSTLFQSMEFRIQGKTVSRISDNVAQTEALHLRMKKSKSWLDSIGKDLILSSPDQAERQQEISSNGIITSGIPERESLEGVTPAATAGLVWSQFDYVTPNRVQFTVANLLIFTANGGRAIPDLREHFKIGQWVAFNDGAEKIRQITLVEAAQLTVSGAALTAVAAANLVNQVRFGKPTGKRSKRVMDYELIWKPCLSIFTQDKALPAGRYELILNPYASNQLKTRTIESNYANRVEGAGNDFTSNISQMYFYGALVKGRRVQDYSYLIDLDETNCKVQNITGGTALSQEHFQVEPSTYALTLAFQDREEGNAANTLHSCTKFKVNKGEELRLNRLFLNYANMNKPQPDADPDYVPASARDYTLQRYNDSMIYSGQYNNSGGCETLQDWQDRGPYYHFKWYKDGSDRSTQVTTNFSFSTALTADRGRVLLFNHYRKVASVRIENGMVVDVRTQEI